MAQNGLRLSNSHLNPENDDVLYHFGISKRSHDLPKLFRDVQFVCTGGSHGRLQRVAHKMAESLGLADGSEKRNLSNSDRYCMYKVGPVLCVNHGIGAPSLSVMLIEVFKLLYYAGCRNVTFFRIGTSGGIGLEPGTVVVSKGALNGRLEPYHIQYVFGKEIKHPVVLDEQLAAQLVEVAKECNIPVDTGLTMCADDFYEGQGRLDGAFCNYSDADKMQFIDKLFELGVRNIEMEATCLSSMVARAGGKAAIICAAIVNRREGDQVKTEKSVLKQWEDRPIDLVVAYVKKHWKQANGSAV